MRKFTKVHEKVASMLFARGAVKFASPGCGYKLAHHDVDPHAPLSPFYLNLRTKGYKGGTLDEDDLALIGALMWGVAHANDLRPDTHTYVGIPRAGDPLADALLMAAQKTDFAATFSAARISLQKDDKSREIIGMERMCNMHSGADRKHVTLDDVVTHGTSVARVVELLKPCSRHITDHIVLVDRDQGCRARLAQQGITLHAAFNINDLLDFYRAGGHITPEVHERSVAYLRSATP